ncbi:MAG: putative nucleotide-diphospho-sugar transferase [Paracoccaceae bacterium]|nr:putative nucleotide-diphospho-sugar transferase [Paracoccaceae bacterium]
MTDGVIYVATGADYVDLALQSVKSLRASNPGVPADLFTDDPDRAGLDAFDRVHRVPRIHARAKLDCLPLSRFERTLFLDADTLVLGDLGDLWAVADRFDLALAHDVRRRSELIREGLEEDTPYAFPQMNSGVMLYRKTGAALAFFANWAARYQKSGVARDQIILKDLLWQGDLRFYVLPPEFNLRRVTVLDAWEPLDAEVKIIHSHRLMDHLKGGQRISTLEDLLVAEREALDGEWRQLGPQRRSQWFVRNDGDGS